MSSGDFEEIAHSGGTITFRIGVNEEGQRGYQQSYRNASINSVSLISVYALLEQGVVVGEGRIHPGNVMSPPPLAGCVHVMIGSDSQGHFGHDCESCGGYWRSGPWPNFCPYCRRKDHSFQFLSNAQRRYVAHYCETLRNAIDTGQDGDFVIDMDAVAAASKTKGDRPLFYVSEESQQHKFRCSACNAFNDVIGRFAYCSSCVTRNDETIFKAELAVMREQISANDSGNVVRNAVSAFDNVVGQANRQLLQLVPLSKRRADRLKRGRFHDIEEVESILRWFDINLSASLSPEEISFVRRLFLRRHVYEHNGGEVDSIYIQKSDDNTIRLKQQLSETVEDLHRLLSILSRLVHNIHIGFHELLPPFEDPIAACALEISRLQKSPG